MHAKIMLYFSIESTNFLVKKLTTQNFWRSSYLDISFYFGAFFFLSKVPIFWWKNWQLKIFGGAPTLTFHFILVQNYAIDFDKSTIFFCIIQELILSRVWVSSAIWFLILWIGAYSLKISWICMQKLCFIFL